MKIQQIDEMDNLKTQLGKRGTERIRYHQNRGQSVPKNSYDLVNTVIYDMQHLKPNTPCNTVDDLLTGACRNFGNRQDLNLNRLYLIFQTIPIINTKEVVKMTGLSERQASTYVRAARFTLPFLLDYFLDGQWEEYEVDVDRWDEGG